MKTIFMVFVTLLLSSAFLMNCQQTKETDTGAAAKVATAQHVEKVSLDVEGMTCSGCEMNVESHLKELPGVLEVKADYESGKAAVEIDKENVDVKQLIAAVQEAGYKAKLASAENHTSN